MNRTAVSYAQRVGDEQEPIVMVHALTKRYRGGQKALCDFSLQVAVGELFGLIGPDGAGKTTALQIIAGVMTASSGEIRVLKDLPEKMRSGIGLVSQNFSLFPDLTVDENLRYEAQVCGVSSRDYKERRQKYLERFGLFNVTDRLAGNLSGGMKQKLAVCCALLSHPQLLLLDEPTNGLDPLSRRELWHELSLLSHEGFTTIIATPNLEDAERCSRVALMHEGSLIACGSPLELKKSLKLRRLSITVSELEIADRIEKNILQAGQHGVVDVHAHADRVDLLVSTQAAEEAGRDAASAAGVSSDHVTTALPIIENVMTVRLKELGVREQETYAFPRINESRQHSRQDGPALVVNDLCRRFGRVEAVKRVTFAVDYGEIYGLLGANGAGKTTTIKMLCGLIEPSGGEVVLAGEKARERSMKLRKNLGYMSQKFTLYDGLTVLENLEFYSGVYEIPERAAREKISWVIKSCGLSGMENSLVRSLPRGWKQRIAFGCSIMHEPQILFLDEPTAGVDPIARRQLWHLIRQFADQGACILVTTHHMDEAEYCHRMGLLTEGELFLEGTPREIKSAQKGQVFEFVPDDVKKAEDILSEKMSDWRLAILGESMQVMLDSADGLDEVKQLLQRNHVVTRGWRLVPISLEQAFIAAICRRGSEKP